MIAVSALAVQTFNTDIVLELMKAYGVANEDTDKTLSFWLTALILAGGSTGVYNILVALGYRDPRQTKPQTSEPSHNKAWVSVRVDRKAAVGPILVRLNKHTAPPQSNPIALAGVVARQPIWRRLRDVFFLDSDRFPQTGGYEVDSAHPIGWKSKQQTPMVNRFPAKSMVTTCLLSERSSIWLSLYNGLFCNQDASATA